LLLLFIDIEKDNSNLEIEREVLPMDVLVADNDISALSNIVELIKRWGHHAEKSETAEGTLDKVREKPFDLVLLDMSLPDMTAQDLIGKLKELWPDIGIVTMTSTSTNELEKGIRTLGIVYYMSKPVSENILKDILDHISTKKKNTLSADSGLNSF
jgi:DNA-binding NtrC family response regulator